MGWIEDRAEEAAAALQVRLGRRLGGRYNGAWLASTDSGDVVIKPGPPDDAHSFDRVVEALGLLPRLRRRGYPIPRHLGVLTVNGLTVTMQELAAGTVPARLDLTTATQLVDLMMLQADIGRSDGSRTADPVEWTPPDDASGRAALPHADEARLGAIVAETRDVTQATQTAWRAGDVMHTDLHGENVLIDLDGRVNAVVDWEGARVGDWRYDLAMLAWFHRPEHPVTPDAAEFLRSSLLHHTDRAALALLAAATTQT